MTGNVAAPLPRYRIADPTVPAGNMRSRRTGESVAQLAGYPEPRGKLMVWLHTNPSPSGWLQP